MEITMEFLLTFATALFCYKIFSAILNYLAREKDDRKRSIYRNFPAANAYFLGKVQSDGSTVVKLKDMLTGHTIANVAVFSDSLEKAKTHPINEKYLFFIRESQTYGSRFPCYEQRSNYHVGDFYSIQSRVPPNEGISLPVYLDINSKVYYDSKNFIVVEHIEQQS